MFNQNINFNTITIIAINENINEIIFDSQFSYCPLIWMFISRSSNHKVNRLHERSLRILYKDDISNFSELLQKNNSVTVHTRNIHLVSLGEFSQH